MEKTAEEWKRMKRFEKIRTIREKLEENKTITIKLNPPRIHLDTHQAEHCSDQPMPHTTQSEQDRDQAEQIVPSHTDLQEAPRQDLDPHVGDHPEHEAGQADSHEAPHQDVHPHDQHCDQDDHPEQGEDSAGKQEEEAHRAQDLLDVQQHEGDLPGLRTTKASAHDEAPCQDQLPNDQPDQQCDKDDNPEQGEDEANKQDDAPHHDQGPHDVQLHDEGDQPVNGAAPAISLDEAPRQDQL